VERERGRSKKEHIEIDGGRERVLVELVFLLLCVMIEVIELLIIDLFDSDIIILMLYRDGLLGLELRYPKTQQSISL